MGGSKSPASPCAGPSALGGCPETRPSPVRIAVHAAGDRALRAGDGHPGQDPVADPEMLGQGRLPVLPDEDALDLTDRVDHVRDVARLREEMLMDEPVAIRQEDPEVRVRMIPADDLERGVLRVHLGVDLRPGLVGERHLGELFLGPLAADRFGDLGERPDLVAMPGPDQHPADLDRGVLAGVLPERGMDLGREEDAIRLVPPAGKDPLRQILALQQPDVEFAHSLWSWVMGS